MLTYCKRCVMPDTKPDLHLDDEGVCNACRSYEHRKQVDWDARYRELPRILEKYRRHDGSNWTVSYRSAVERTARTKWYACFSLALTAMRDVDDLRSVCPGSPEHRKPEATRCGLRRGVAESNCSCQAEPDRANAGRRHLVARTCRNLHDPRARGSAVQRPADRLGRELTERVRRSGVGVGEQHPEPSLARGVRRSARYACVRPRRPGRHRGQAT